MRRCSAPLLSLGCLLALTLSCYGGAILQGRQFGYRDAAHYYYPLYERVEQEWRAGRWPLWEPEENSGMPLLGNPTAAVLYPGKILYRILPFAWGARLYVVAHTVLAFLGMITLLRSWGTSWTGTTLGALGYAFGAPILFQYCNIIFLVGAAWTPFGFRAIDRWLRLGRWTGVLELAAVLSLQALGGDPETAYILGICAGGYALGLAYWHTHPRRGTRRVGTLAVAAVLVGVLWILGTLAAARWLPSFRPKHAPPLVLPLPWMPWVPNLVAGIWGFFGLVVVVRWLRGKQRSNLFPMLAGLAGAAVLLAALAAAQLLPVLEFTGQSIRAAGGGPHDIYPFSLEPVRVAEFVWPNVFGTHFQGNRSWLSMVPPAGRHPKLWVPSLYLGGLTIVLALAGVGFRGGPPWRGWLTAVAAVSLVAGFGEYASPLWWARWDHSLRQSIGPHDDSDVGAIRFDAHLRDGDGSLYWGLATILPGFRQFRFPCKLLGFTALALAALSGIGWDRLMAGRIRRAAIPAAIFLVASLIGLIATAILRERILAYFELSPKGDVGSVFGPLEVTGAFGELQWALVHGSVVFALGLALAIRGWRRPGLAGVVALLAATTDLALANGRIVITVPQKVIEKKSKVLELIEEAERKEPAAGPYRIHRMPIWNPNIWRQESSPNRVQDFVEWERATLQPKYGIADGVQYTWSLGVSELYDYEWFFGGFLPKIDAQTAQMLPGSKPGQQVVYFPRRAFDLWNTRYFVIPAYPNGWRDELRGFAAFLADSDPIYPPEGTLIGPENLDRYRRWIEREDFQILRNKNAYPRAWTVHNARFYSPIFGLDRKDREVQMEEILYQNDAIWHDPNRSVYDPGKLAWMESDKRADLIPYLSGSDPTQSESATVTSYGPQRVELDVVLERPGVVILSDVFYPGWRLRIDNVESPIYRANRMMRGAAVNAGKHHLIYTFEPRSFQVGGQVSLGALTVLAVLGIAAARWPCYSGLSAGKPDAS